MDDPNMTAQPPDPPPAAEQKKDGVNEPFRGASVSSFMNSQAPPVAVAENEPDKPLEVFSSEQTSEPIPITDGNRHHVTPSKEPAVEKEEEKSEPVPVTDGNRHLLYH